ncbi:unnamed protein product [Sympodiomycopsis kandeliae]
MSVAQSSATTSPVQHAPSSRADEADTSPISTQEQSTSEVPRIETLAATPLVDEDGISASPRLPLEEQDGPKSPGTEGIPILPQSASQKDLSFHDGSPTYFHSPPNSSKLAVPTASNGSFSLSPPIDASQERRRSSVSTNSSTSTFRVRRKPAPSDDGASSLGDEPARKYSTNSLSVDGTYSRRGSAVSSSSSASFGRPHPSTFTSSPNQVSLPLPSPARRLSSSSVGNRSTGAPALSPRSAFRSLVATETPADLAEAKEIPADLTAASKPEGQSRTFSPLSLRNEIPSRPATATEISRPPSRLPPKKELQTLTLSRPSTAPAHGQLAQGSFSRKETVMVDGQTFIFGGAEPRDEKDPDSLSIASGSRIATSEAAETLRKSDADSLPSPQRRNVVGRVVDLSSVTAAMAKASADRSESSNHRTLPSISSWQNLERQATISSSNSYRGGRVPFMRPKGRAESSDGLAARAQLQQSLLPARPGTSNGLISTLPLRRTPFKRQSMGKNESSINSSQRLTPLEAPEEEETAGSYAIEPPSRRALQEAATLTVFSESGEMVRFGEIFAEKRILICFLRHWFCPMCQEFAHSMQRLDPLPLQRANLGLIVVGQGHPHVLSAYKKVTGVPEWIKMYADPTRKLYKVLGMTKKTNDPGPACAKPDYVQKSMLKGSLSAIRKGLFEMPLRTPGDLKLLGGEFIFGPGIDCSFTHRMVTTRGHMDLPRILTQAGCDMSLQSARAIGDELGRNDDTKSVDRVHGRRRLGKTVKQIARNLELDRQKSLGSSSAFFRPTSRASTIRGYSQDIPAVPKLPAAAALESSRALAKSASQPQYLSNAVHSRMRPRAAKASPSTIPDGNEYGDENEEDEDDDDDIFGKPRRKAQDMSLADAIRMGPPDDGAQAALIAKQRKTLADGPSSSARNSSAEHSSHRSTAGTGSRKQSEEDASSRKGSLQLSPASTSAPFQVPSVAKRSLLDVAMKGMRRTTSTPDFVQSQSPRSSSSSSDLRSLSKVDGTTTDRRKPSKLSNVTNTQGVDEDRSSPLPASVNDRSLAPDSEDGKAAVSCIPSDAATVASERDLTPTAIEATTTSKTASEPPKQNDPSSNPPAHQTDMAVPQAPVADHQDVPGSGTLEKVSSPMVPLMQAGEAIRPVERPPSSSSTLRRAASGRAKDRDQDAPSIAISENNRSPLLRRDSLNKTLPPLPPAVAPAVEDNLGSVGPMSQKVVNPTEELRPSQESQNRFPELGAENHIGGGVGVGSFLDDLDVLDGFTRTVSGYNERNDRLYSSNGGGYEPRESFESWTETEAANSDSDMEHEPGWVRPPSSRLSTYTARPGYADGANNGVRYSTDTRSSMKSSYSQGSLYSEGPRTSMSYGRPSLDVSERSFSDDDGNGGEYSDGSQDYDRRQSEDDSRSDSTASPDERDRSREVYKSNSNDNAGHLSIVPRNGYSSHTRIANGYLPPRTLDTFDEEEEEEEEAARQDEEEGTSTVGH